MKQYGLYRPGKHQQRLIKQLSSAMTRTISDFAMLAPGETIGVAVSGGKDSLSLLYMLQHIKRKAPFDFDLLALHVDAGFIAEGISGLQQFCHDLSLPLAIIRKPMREIVEAKLRLGSSFCSFCASMKRGSLYELAQKHGVTKIALGHHREDVIETLLLNMFFNGRIKAMSPHLLSDAGSIRIVRPMLNVGEEKIVQFARSMNFPLLTSLCPHTRDNDGGKRNWCKQLLAELESQHPGLKQSLLSSLANIESSHTLDRKLYTFDPYESHDKPNKHISPKTL